MLRWHLTGGNRKLWKNVDVTAVEFDPEIAEIYQHYYPDDNVVVDDAHKYLLDHYKEYDFIWSSPPCPSHSDIRRCGVMRGQYPAVYPDVRLWEEITLLTHYFKKQKWVIENVKPYYKPIIEPAFELDRHFFWSNFYAPPDKFNKREVIHCSINNQSNIFGYDLSRFKVKDKRRLLRNMVNPEVGEHILNTARGIKPTKKNQMELFA